MKVLYLFLIVLTGIFLTNCSSDDVNGNVGEKGDGTIDLAVSGRVGTLVGEHLTTYVKSLDLFLFRENENGVFVLERSVILTKAHLDGLNEEGRAVAPGFTSTRSVTFNSLPLGVYKIVGVGNARDSAGGTLSNATLTGIEQGNRMDEVIAEVTAGRPSPRLFYGETDSIVLGASVSAAPRLNLFRKVSMFALTVEKIPQSVVRIDMEVGNTYGAFSMTGNFLSDVVIGVTIFNTYQFPASFNRAVLISVSLPTAVTNAPGSSFVLKFRLDNGLVMVVPLPKDYVLKSNTITKLTATVNVNTPGGGWSVDFTIDVAADVEWNVDQEPDIII